jgi:hypothetical protein
MCVYMFFRLVVQISSIVTNFEILFTNQHGPGIYPNLRNCSSYVHCGRSWDSSVGIATIYGLGGLGFGVRFPAKARFHIISGAHPASYPTGMNWKLYTPGKRQGREVDRSPPFSAEGNNGGFVPPFPKMPSCRDT